MHALSAIPYLEDGTLGQRTFAQSYPGPNADPDEPRQLWRMLYDEENLAPPSAIQRTFSEGGRGVVYVYNADRGKQSHGTFSDLNARSLTIYLGAISSSTPMTESSTDGHD